MFEYLHIRNLAIIEDVELELGPGLCVITGETGAGKSILVGAIAALRGARVSRELVRDGAEKGLVEAVLRRANPRNPGAADGGEADAGGGSDGGDAGAASDASDASDATAAAHSRGAAEPLTLSRVVSAGGRSRQRVDGELVTARELGQTVAPLVDISGQHDGQTLTDAASHRRLLDAAGVSRRARRGVRDAVTRLRDLGARLGQLNVDDREREARLDLLRFQADELEALDPQPGEEAELEAERRRLGAAAELEQASRGAHALIYEEEGSAADRLARACRMLAGVVDADDELGEPLQRLEEAQALVEDSGRALLRYAEGIEGDPARLEQVEDRLAALRRLGRKHGETVEGLAGLRQRLAAEIEELQGADERLAALRRELDEVREQAHAAATTLTRARQRAARSLRKAVEANLARLGMPEARFEVRMEPRSARKGDDPDRVFEGKRLTADGWDRVEFFIAPNPGEEAHPLARTASGGELSRIMLALKLVLADGDSVVTYVFDEVDAGIGGATADAVGQALAEVARHRQVICITHLPAIAAFADQHFRVSKRQESGRTLAGIEGLEGAARIDEVARMLGGERVTRKTRGAAEELVKRARQRLGSV